MESWAPIGFALLLAVIRPLTLRLAGGYDWGNFPQEVAYSGLAYDVWGLTQLAAGRKIIKKRYRFWVIMSPFIHLISYLLVLLLASEVAQAKAIWPLILPVVGLAAFGIPTMIARGCSK